MQQKTESKVLPLQTLQKRKRLLVYPLLIVPFLTLAFWALGGGRVKTGNDNNNTSAGLNLQLPDARLKEDGSENKLGFYEEADRNSPKLGQRGADLEFPSHGIKDSALISSSELSYSYNPTPPFSTTTIRDPNEEKVYQKLAELNRQLGSAATNPGSSHQLTEPFKTGPPSSAIYENSLLKKGMQTTNAKNETTKDPEMDQLNTLMEKVLDIQHPERVASRKEEPSKKRQVIVLPVHAQATGTISLLDTSGIDGDASNRFYGLNDQAIAEAENSIEAVILQSQTLVKGSVMKLQLLQDVFISGALIPKGQLVYGIVSLEEERLHIAINSIRCGHSIYPVSLTVYDLDGLPGIYIPGAVTRDVAKQSADNSLQLLPLSSLDPSLKAQAASAGISTAKTLLSRKAKEVKVTVKGGYQVLLKNKISE